MCAGSSRARLHRLERLGEVAFDDLAFGLPAGGAPHFEERALADDDDGAVDPGPLPEGSGDEDASLLVELDLGGAAEEGAAEATVFLAGAYAVQQPFCFSLELVGGIDLEAAVRALGEDDGRAEGVTIARRDSDPA